MKRILSMMLMVGVIAVGAIGCSDKATATKKTTVSTPGGETTTTTSQEVKQSGSNPPAPQK